MEFHAACKDYLGHILPLGLSLQLFDSEDQRISDVTNMLRSRPRQSFDQMYSSEVVRDYDSKLVSKLNDYVRDINRMTDPSTFQPAELRAKLDGIYQLVHGTPFTY
jgi:hypothetical protein